MIFLSDFAPEMVSFLCNKRAVKTIMCTLIAVLFQFSQLVDNDVVAIMRSVPPPPPSVTLTPCAAATLQHPCPPTTSTLGGDMPSSWDPSSLPGSLFRGSPYSPSAATVSPLPPRFHIQPTGAPDPHLWYHLEKPTVAHLQVPWFACIPISQ